VADREVFEIEKGDEDGERRMTKGEKKGKG
jgi:hypothetical protein